MKSIIATFITLSIVVFATSFAFANPIKGTPATANTTTTVVTVVTPEAEMSAAMDAVLMNIVANNTYAVQTTTMDNAEMVTLVSGSEIVVSNHFAVHTFGEKTSSNDIAPVAAATETIELDAEQL